MLKIYVFGNPDLEFDSIAIEVAKQLEPELPAVKFVYHDPVQDFEPGERNIILMDAAMGISDVQLHQDLDALVHDGATTMHDFDIGFNLKLLKKIGKIRSVKIIAIPYDLDPDRAADEVNEIIASLVAES